MRAMLWFIVAVAITGCAAHQGPSPGRLANYPKVADNRIANLERAARYPWLDDGVCAVREASGEWRGLVEKCYHALDLSRIRFQDPQHRCAVASVDAATMGPLVGICLMVQPELVVGAIIIVGVVVVAAAIAAEIAKEETPKCEIIYGACVDAVGKGGLTIEACDNCRRFCEKEGWWDPRICGFSPVTHQAR